MVNFAVTAKLICAFIFPYAKCWFSHDMAHVLVQNVLETLFFLKYLNFCQFHSDYAEKLHLLCLFSWVCVDVTQIILSGN